MRYRGLEVIPSSSVESGGVEVVPISASRYHEVSMLGLEVVPATPSLASAELVQAVPENCNKLTTNSTPKIIAPTRY
jgi:hypothetical protein